MIPKDYKNKFVKTLYVRRMFNTPPDEIIPNSLLSEVSKRYEANSFLYIKDIRRDKWSQWIIEAITQDLSTVYFELHYDDINEVLEIIE